MYLNPFSNAIQYSQQPGSRFENEANPTWCPDLANDPALMAWLDDEVDLVSTTDLVVADATLSGAWVEGVADYAFGYQYRGFTTLTRSSGTFEPDRRPPGESTCGCRRVGRFRPVRIRATTGRSPEPSAARQRGASASTSERGTH